MIIQSAQSVQKNKSARPAILRLDVPSPDVAQRHVVIATVLLLAAVALGWAVFSTVQAANAPKTVKIGLIAPFEGVYRNSGYEAIFAVKLALQERNQGNGLNGYRVELVALNDFNDPAEARRQAQALVTDPDVMGVVGHLTSEATLAALPVYNAANLAVSVPWSVDPAVFNQPGVVSVAATTEKTSAYLDAKIKKMGFEQVDSLTDKNDIEAVSVDAQALRLNSDAVTAAETLLALVENANTLPVFGEVDVGSRQLPQAAGLAADGVMIVSPGPDIIDAPGYEDFAAAYQNMAGFPPNPRAILAYDATHVLLDAIEQAMISNDKWYNNQPNRTGISTVISNIQHQGVSGPILFNKQGQRLDAPLWLYQISEMSYPGILIDP